MLLKARTEQVDTIVANGGFALNQAVSANKYLWFGAANLHSMTLI